jgi:hypothetical protein
MQKLVFAIVFSISLSSVPAWGQQATPNKKPLTNTPTATTTAPSTAVAPPSVTQPTTIYTSTDELKATPEMWFYERTLKESKDPKNIVRAKAMFDSQQRANRLAAMRWFGLSNSRPRVSPDPVNVYPPAWSSNMPLQGNRWQATGGQPYYVARPEIIEVRPY